MAVASSPFSLAQHASNLSQGPQRDGSITGSDCSCRGLGLQSSSSNFFQRKELHIQRKEAAFRIYFSDIVQGRGAFKTLKFLPVSAASAVRSQNQATVAEESGSPSASSFRVALAYGPGPLEKSAALQTEEVEVPQSEDIPETGGGGGGLGNGRGGGGGGGGGEGGGGEGADRGDEAGEGEDKEAGMSLSQRLTLVYAGVVGSRCFLSFKHCGCWLAGVVRNGAKPLTSVY